LRAEKIAAFSAPLLRIFLFWSNSDSNSIDSKFSLLFTSPWLFIQSI
jgi:hypothetical protein